MWIAVFVQFQMAATTPSTLLEYLSLSWASSTSYHLLSHIVDCCHFLQNTFSHINIDNDSINWCRENNNYFKKIFDFCQYSILKYRCIQWVLQITTERMSQTKQKASNQSRENLYIHVWITVRTFNHDLTFEKVWFEKSKWDAPLGTCSMGVLSY